MSEPVLHVRVRWAHVSRFQTKEPAAGTVKRYVSDRRIMDRGELVEHTMFLVESWPKLLLRIRELENARGQAADTEVAAEKRASQRRRKRDRALEAQPVVGPAGQAHEEPAVITASDVHSDVNSV